MNHHGPDNVQRVINQMANRVKGGNAVALIGFFGLPGSGKSEAAILLADEIQRVLGSGPLQPLDLDHQLRFKPKDFPTMAQSAPRLKAVFCDEGAGEGGNKMRQMGTNNVEVGIDLDACRGRQQPILWCNPFRRDLSPQITKHMAWAIEFSLDHTATFWEAEPVDPMFGKEPYFHERFTVGTPDDPFPWLGQYRPDIRERYLWLKDEHMAGRDPFRQPREQRELARYRQAIGRVLG